MFVGENTNKGKIPDFKFQISGWLTFMRLLVKTPTKAKNAILELQVTILLPKVTYSLAKVTYSLPNMSYCLPNMSYCLAKVTILLPKVTYSLANLPQFAVVGVFTNNQ